MRFLASARKNIIAALHVPFINTCRPSQDYSAAAVAVNNTRERTAELTMAGALYSLILGLCVFTTRASGCVGESLYAGIDIIAGRSP